MQLIQPGTLPNDPAHPLVVKDKLESLKFEDAWPAPLVGRALSFINLYLNNEIDEGTLYFNLSNIKKSKNDFSSYEGNLRKNQLDDILNPLIDNLKGA